MNLPISQRFSRFSDHVRRTIRLNPDGLFLLIVLGALIALEVFGYSATLFALEDILGGHGAESFSWPIILSCAFCVMDAVGVAKLLSTQKPEDKDSGRWYLFGAWAAAAGMNAVLTWWGISAKVYSQPVPAVMLIDPMIYVAVVPVLVSVMVWIIRMLMIGLLVNALQSQPKKISKKNTTAAANKLGFKPSQQPIPTGYHPIPEHARLDENGFPM